MKKKSTPYFTKDTEAAIVEYNNSTDFEYRSKLYNDRIYRSFFKLTENIIHTFKFYHTEVENIEDLQHEVIIFLTSKMHLFNPEKGAKAYSYFGTIAKRYLIFNNTKNYKKKIDHLDIEIFKNDDENTNNSNSSLIYTTEVFEGEGNHSDRLSNFMDEYLIYCNENLFELFPKRENLNIFNKKALYIYIREMVDIKTSHITKVSKKLHSIFKEGYVFYLEHGYVKF